MAKYGDGILDGFFGSGISFFLFVFGFWKMTDTIVVVLEGEKEGKETKN